PWLLAPLTPDPRAVIAALVLWLVIKEARVRPNGRILLAALWYAVTAVLFVFANTLTTAASTIFLQNTAPIWVLLLSVPFLGERPSRAEKLSVPVALGGALLFFSVRRFGGRME
ncbi:MAG TPA: EamA family transporter, partial [bacterium]|nr:EamA family transporter [bacterium]